MAGRAAEWADILLVKADEKVTLQRNAVSVGRYYFAGDGVSE